MAQITLTLPEEAYPRLQAAAAAAGETEAEYASRVLQAALRPPSLRRASTKKLHITTPSEIWLALAGAGPFTQC